MQELRKTFISDLRNIMYSLNEEGALSWFNAAHNSAQSCPQWQKYLEKLWDRRLLWAHCYRHSADVRGNNTNNYCERTIGIYKDNVLCRTVAYNAIALANFIVTVMEKYYQSKLREFANGRVSGPHLLLAQLLKKAKFIASADMIKKYIFNPLN